MFCLSESSLPPSLFSNFWPPPAPNLFRFRLSIWIIIWQKVCLLDLLDSTFIGISQTYHDTKISQTNYHFFGHQMWAVVWIPLSTKGRKRRSLAAFLGCKSIGNIKRFHGFFYPLILRILGFWTAPHLGRKIHHPGSPISQFIVLIWWIHPCFILAFISNFCWEGLSKSFACISCIPPRSIWLATPISLGLSWVKAWVLRNRGVSLLHGDFPNFLKTKSYLLRWGRVRWL